MDRKCIDVSWHRREREGRLQGEDPQDLTAREIEIMTMSEEGMTLRAIEQRLGIRHATYKNHLKSAQGKLAKGRGTNALFYEWGRKVGHAIRSRWSGDRRQVEQRRREDRT